MLWCKYCFSTRFPGTTSFRELVQSGKIKLIKGTVVDMARVSTLPSSPPSTSLSQYTLTVNSPAKAEQISLTADIVIFGTGWLTGSYPFLPHSLLEELGLPFTYHVDVNSDSDGLPEREKPFVKLDDESLKALLGDQRTLRQIPQVWEKPGYAARDTANDNVTLDVANGTADKDSEREKVAPYRLYRLMVPTSHLETRNVVMAGMSLLSSTSPMIFGWCWAAISTNVRV